MTNKSEQAAPAMSLESILDEARTASANGDHDAALTILARPQAAGIAPTGALCFQRAQIEFAAGKLADAIRSAQEACRLEPHNGFYAINFALALLRGNLVDQALNLMDKIEIAYPQYRPDVRRFRQQIREQDRLSGITR